MIWKIYVMTTCNRNFQFVLFAKIYRSNSGFNNFKKETRKTPAIINFSLMKKPKVLIGFKYIELRKKRQKIFFISQIVKKDPSNKIRHSTSTLNFQISILK